jgi:hypothetical protein
MACPMPKAPNDMANPTTNTTPTKPASQAVEHRSLQQERSDRFGLAVEHLFDEVVDDEAVVTGEVLDEPVDVVAALQRESSELERGDPSLGSSTERVDVTGGEVQTHRVVEVRSCLVVCESEVRSADLRQLPASPETSQGKWRVGSAGEHEVERRRCVIDEIGDRRCMSVESMTW